MSDTPETQEAIERWRQGKINIFDEMARLEIERNNLQDQRDFCMGEIERLRKERNEQTAQMCQAIGHLSEIAQACQDWLDSIIQEPAVDFIKAIRDWAKKKVAAE